MIIQPEKGTRNVNDLFYEAESRRINMLNREFFHDVQLSKNENDVLVWLCGWDEWTIDGIVSAFKRARDKEQIYDIKFDDIRFNELFKKGSSKIGKSGEFSKWQRIEKHYAYMEGVALKAKNITTHVQNAMDWMLTHQLSSKNLSPGEKLAMTDQFKEEVRIENERKKLEGNSFGGKGGKEVSLQLECDIENGNSSKVHSETWTDSQTAKKAGVGVGTVARYNKVMSVVQE